MGTVHILFLDPTSSEGIEGVKEYLRSVFGPSANIQILHLEPRIWGQTPVTDMLAAVTIAGVPICLRVLYRIVRAKSLKLSVWFDDPQHHGREIVVYPVVAPIQDHKSPPPLPFRRR